jgi:nitric oxide reductase NorE protein
MTDLPIVEDKRTVAAVPGQPDMWVLVLFEALIFSSYFVVYMIWRTRDPVLFLRAQSHLVPAFGVVNTLMLIASSWSIARCVERARAGAYSAALMNAFLTVALGAGFAVSKMYEWSVEMHQGMFFGTNDFFTFYYFLTGIHLIHVLMGFAVLGVAIYQLWSPARRSQEIVETCATYWHMVDFLWVFIFALLYVMR